MADTAHWSNDEWHVESQDADFARLVRCRDGPSALASAGDSVCISVGLLD